MYSFISGAVMLGCWVIALFFWRFWKQTSDRLFQIFSLSFFVLGVERLIPVLLHIEDKPQTFLYVLRLIAFILILVAIINKNRSLSKK
jgi:hypothetical protein